MFRTTTQKAFLTHLFSHAKTNSTTFWGNHFQGKCIGFIVFRMKDVHSSTNLSLAVPACHIAHQIKTKKHGWTQIFHTLDVVARPQRDCCIRKFCVDHPFVASCHWNLNPHFWQLWFVLPSNGWSLLVDASIASCSSWWMDLLPHLHWCSAS